MITKADMPSHDHENSLELLFFLNFILKMYCIRISVLKISTLAMCRFFLG